MPLNVEKIERNFGQIKRNIAKACTKSKRVPTEISVLAAAKGRSIGQIKEAFGAGIGIFGENYLQEAEKKIAQERMPF